MTTKPSRSPITTHVLDLARGKPAQGILVNLEHEEKGTWREIGKGRTDADGRIEDLLARGSQAPSGGYRLSFGTGEYFRAQGGATFYPSVVISFQVTAPGEHYHVPLLVSPYGYSTYRGS
jgi:5-hydroxyisourate hydrolase